MHKITFHCETITPMFLSGADGQTPELRAPSIKGALRFWWRALNGHLATEERGIEKLLEEDEKLWGGTSTENKGKSPVKIKVFDRNEKLIYCSDLKVYAKHNPSGRKTLYEKEGLAYLYYVLLNQKCDDLEGLDVGSSFNVTISSKNKDELINAILSFWAFTIFGSLGTRARRGAGSFYVKKISGDIEIVEDTGIVFNLLPKHKLHEGLKSNIGVLKKKYPNNSVSNEYSTIDFKKVYLSKHDFCTWVEALDHIGKLMLNVRKGKTAKEREDRTFTMDTLDQKAAFGLPIGVQSGKGWTENSLNFDPKEYNRRASPIYITVIKNLDQKYHWLVTHLDGEFAPEGVSLYFKSNNPDLTYKEPGTNEVKREYLFDSEDDQLIKKFIKKIEPHSWHE